VQNAHLLSTLLGYRYTNTYLHTYYNIYARVYARVNIPDFEELGLLSVSALSTYSILISPYVIEPRVLAPCETVRAHVRVSYMHTCIHVHVFTHTCNQPAINVRISGIFCMYVCMYVCVYSCVCVYVCLFVYMYVCTYVRMYVCMNVYKYVCIYVCMYICLYAFMYVCMHACIHVRVYVFVHV